MIEIIEFRKEHLNALKEQDATKWMQAYITNEHAAALEKTEAYTALWMGRPIVCAGLVEFWPGRAELWAIVSQEARQHFLPVQRAVKRHLSMCEHRRLEAVVDAQFPAAQKWVEKLGFTVEIPLMRRYFPDGRDAKLYVKIKD